MVKDTDISLGDLADNALLVLFANGSKPAAMELTRRLGPKVFRHAYYRLQNKSDAEDIALAKCAKWTARDMKARLFCCGQPHLIQRRWKTLWKIKQRHQKNGMNMPERH